MITMAGTIGAGKTAWGAVIAEHFGTELLIEKVDGNPFLPKFYEASEKYSFHLQVYFLNHIFRSYSKVVLMRRLTIVIALSLSTSSATRENISRCW